MGVRMNVINNLITLARGFLCFFIFEIFFGFLWVGNTLNIVQYFIWTIIGAIFFYSVVVTSPSYSKKYPRKTVLFFGFLTFLALFMLDTLHIMIGTDNTVLIAMAVPFTMLHCLTANKSSSSRPAVE